MWQIGVGRKINVILREKTGDLSHIIIKAFNPSGTTDFVAKNLQLTILEFLSFPTEIDKNEDVHSLKWTLNNGRRKIEISSLSQMHQVPSKLVNVVIKRTRGFVWEMETFINFSSEEYQKLFEIIPHLKSQTKTFENQVIDLDESTTVIS